MGSPALRTVPQNRQIWGLVSQIKKAGGLDDETADAMLRAMCRKASGQEHTSQLTVAQAGRVIDALSTELAKYASAPPPPKPTMPKREHAPWGPRGGARGDEKITPAQQRIITQLGELLGWDRARLVGFSRRQTGTLWPQTQAHADKMIEPMKAMVLRQVEPRDVWVRAQAIDGHPALSPALRGHVAALCRAFSEADAVGTLNQVLTAAKLAWLVEAEAAVEEAR